MAKENIIKDRIKKYGTVAWREVKPLQSADFKKYRPEQIKKLKESIRKNGFTTPMFIWETPKGEMILLDGFHRIIAFKELESIDGVFIPEKVPALFVDCKDKKDAKKVLLILNSHYAEIQEDALWEFVSDLNLDELVAEIDIPNIDMTATGEEKAGRDEAFIEKVDYENLKKAYFESSNRYGIPDIKKQSIDISDVVGFNYVLNKGEREKTVHFFIDDYQFVRLWYRPDDYIEKIRKFNGMFSPDFSLYLDFPISLQIYNTYRNRWIARYFQENGIPVIPTVGWSDERSFDFCFLGIPKGSDVAVGTVGVVTREESRKMFITGYNEMIKQIEPRTVYIYGSPIEGLTGNIRYIPARRFATAKGEQ